MPVDWCIVAGPVVSWIVEALKRIPIIKRYPKIAALVIAGIAGAVEYAGGAVPLAEVLRCVVQAWGLAIATHEALTEPVQRLVATNGGK